MIKPVNWSMASHPINYIVILLMLVIAGAAGHMILSLFSAEPKTLTSTYSNLPAGQQAQTNTLTPRDAAAGLSA